MSSREDYKWTDEAKNLKEGLPPNHKREETKSESTIDQLSKSEEQINILIIQELQSFLSTGMLPEYLPEAIQERIEELKGNKSSI